jgi:hypothetical protein
LKGVFQPKAITAAMITISTNSRFMSEIARKNGVRSMEIVKSLKRVNPESFRGTRLYGVKSLKRSSDRRHPGNLGEDFRVALTRTAPTSAARSAFIFPLSN